MNVQEGKFITLEGTEGVGKSSNLQFIHDYLLQSGKDVVVTREPGGTPLAEEIRSLLLSPRDESMCHLTELLLVFAARAQHLEAVIKPALARGSWVLSDRFTDATFAYQGYGRGLSLDVIETLQSMVQGELRPDLTIVLDVDVETGLSRARDRGALDRIESEQRQFFDDVRQGYLALAKKNPQRYAIVDASPSLSKVQMQIEEYLTPLI